MTIGLIYHGKDKDVVVLGNTLKEAEIIFQKNKTEIRRFLKARMDMPQETPNLKVAKLKESTTNRILELKKRRFFDKPRTGGEIIEELRSMDYHYKLSDLTLPLRRLVRKEELRRTKELLGAGKSRHLMWISANKQRKG